MKHFLIPDFKLLFRPCFNVFGQVRRHVLKSAVAASSAFFLVLTYNFPYLWFASTLLTHIDMLTVYRPANASCSAPSPPYTATDLS